MKTKILGLLVMGAMVYSCASKPVAATAPKEEVKVVILTAELAEGKNLYENNCAQCHKLFEPTDFSKEQWKPIVSRMQRKAKLDDTQGARIYDYLTSNL